MDTDRNMLTMFDVLKKEKKTKVENLMFSRNSFAQTVQNLFALSFLFKDGRIQIDVDENGSQIASIPVVDVVMEIFWFIFFVYVLGLVMIFLFHCLEIVLLQKTSRMESLLATISSSDLTLMIGRYVTKHVMKFSSYLSKCQLTTRGNHLSKSNQPIFFFLQVEIE